MAAFALWLASSADTIPFLPFREIVAEGCGYGLNGWRNANRPLADVLLILVGHSSHGPCKMSAGCMSCNGHSLQEIRMGITVFPRWPSYKTRSPIERTFWGSIPSFVVLLNLSMQVKTGSSSSFSEYFRVVLTDQSSSSFCILSAPNAPQSKHETTVLQSVGVLCTDWTGIEFTRCPAQNAERHKTSN